MGVAMTHIVFLTQVIDPDDPTLGFVTSWIDALAARVDGVTAVGNEVRGVSSLAPNVRVVSLGKERGAGRASRAVALQRAVATSGGPRCAVLLRTCVPSISNIDGTGHRGATDTDDALVRSPVGHPRPACGRAPHGCGADFASWGVPAAELQGSHRWPGHGHRPHRFRPRSERLRGPSGETGRDRQDIAVQGIRPGDPSAGEGSSRGRRCHP